MARRVVCELIKEEVGGSRKTCLKPRRRKGIGIEICHRQANEGKKVTKVASILICKLEECKSKQENFDQSLKSLRTTRQ